jgi:hypothetical protein
MGHDRNERATNIEVFPASLFSSLFWPFCSRLEVGSTALLIALVALLDFQAH